MQKHSHTSTTPDGALRHFQHIVAPLHDHEGKTTQFLAMSLDVTEHVERVNQIEMLQQLSKQLQGVLELDRLFYLILTCVTAGQGLGFNRAVLMLANREQGALEGRMAVGPGSAEEAGRIWETIREERKTLDDFMEQYDQMTPAEHQALVAQALPMRFSLTETSEAPVACLVNKEAILVANAPADPRVGARSRSLIGADQFVAVPLVVRAEPIGVILADNRFSRHPITEALTGLLATFGGQAALCIANAWAYHRLEEKIQQLAEARDRNIRSERLAAIGSMAAHVAHEIRNPLVTIGGFARSILRSSESSTVCGQHARIIVDEVARLEKILANVMNFTKPSPPHRTEISIDEVLEKTCVLLGQELKAKNIELVKHLDLKPDKVWVDANQMKQVFINVIQNAIDSIESRGRIIITTAEEDNRVRIDVADSGGGMTAEVQESIFLPFFTTKPDGTGLGLAVCRKIVEDHGGEMQVQSSVGVGTTFTILLPRLGP
jgi:signal transduction histidine kinase